MKTTVLVPWLLAPERKRIVVAQGGGDAAKTISILQTLAIRRTQMPRSLATVTAMDLPNLKGGAMHTFQKWVLPDFRTDVAKFNISESKYHFRNRSVLEFKSYDSPDDAAGSERDDLFINEAPGVTYDMFWQLQRKAHGRIFVDYNPIHYFWVHDKLHPVTEDGDGIINPNQEKEFVGQVDLVVVDHRHNPFLTKEEHRRYEDIGDPDMFKVYARGRTGKIKGLIYGHFKKWEGSYPEDWPRHIWGLDIGYTNDPTVVMKIAVNVRKRVGKECCYETGLSEAAVKAILEREGYKPGEMVYCDTDANFINGLRLIGVAAVPAIKGPGSVAARISKVRQHECWYIGENFEKEIMSYKFMEVEDVMTGKKVLTNIPEDLGWDHACDAFGYADYTDGFRNP